MGKATPGEKIRAARMALSLSQAQLGKKTGISGQMICHIEKGRKGVTYSSARALAKALRLPWKDLYTGVVPARYAAELHARAGK